MEAPSQLLESTRVLSLVSTSDDLVVPVDQIANCIRHLTKVAENYNFKLFTLAHAGDGNLHFQILKGEMSDEQWEDEVSRFHAELILMFTVWAVAFPASMASELRRSKPWKNIRSR